MDSNSKQLLYRNAYLRINSKINENTNLKTNLEINENVCQYCNIEKANITIRLKHEQYCDKKDSYIIKESFYAPTKILEQMDEELIIEDDWLKLLNHYERWHIKKLSNNYKQAYNLVKHLRNEKLLILLDKISYESKRFHTYLNDRTIEYPPAYWSSLTLRDFQIS